MSARTVAITNTTAERSDSIWGRIDQLRDIAYVDFRANFMEGIVTGKWALTQNSAGAWDTQASEAGRMGMVRVDTGDATQYHGPNIQADNSGLFIPAVDKIIAFEACIRPTTTMASDFFLGLAGVNATVLTTNGHSFTETNTIGFESLTGDKVLLGRGDKAGTADTSTVNGGDALVVATWYNLGFVVEGLTKVTFFVNGVAQTDTIVTANIPTAEALAPTFALHNYASERGYCDILWMRAAQTL